MRITKENLTRYDQHFKSWHRRRLAGGNALKNWTQTEEAGAVQFYPVGGSPLEGKVKFSFTEVPPASGDKGPENPSTITGVSQVEATRCGKNIIPFPYRHTSRTADGITWTVNNDKSITANGTATANTIFIVWAGGVMKAPRGITYTLSGCPSTGSYSTYYIQCGDAFFDIGAGRIFSFSSSHAQYMQICVKNGVTVDNVVFRPQLELGTTATSFEPYDGTDYPLSLGSTYYGGEIDLATGLMTVTHRIREISGDPYTTTSEENYTKFEYRVSDQIQNTGISNPSSACSHFNNGSNTPDRFSFGLARLYFCSSNITSGADFSAWLTEQKNAGTPVVVAYKLNTPTTVQLSPLALAALAQTSRHEPRLNTVYTDADSVQITYRKSPIRAATEQEMAILGLGGNV